MAKTPESIGKYKIVTEIARGGMGAVYKAMHPTLKRPVILKKLTLRSSASLVERFKREARIMMDFRNENIVDVYDHFKEGTSYYIVLEFVDGVSLEQLIQQERYLPGDVAAYIFLDACKALKYAHDKGVIHRDIKPANILISKNGEVKLVDFGIAASVEDEEAGLTREGTTLGTPSYMAPEQFENTRNVDKRADIYSMGVMLYEMTTGKKPYPGSISAEALAKIYKGKYVHPKKLNPDIDRSLTRIIKRTIKPKASKRFQDLWPLLRKLQKRFPPRKEAEVKEQITALIRGEGYTPPEYKPSKRKRFLPVAAVLIAGVGLGLWFWYSGLHYEYIMPEEAGAVKFRLFVPSDDRGPENLGIYSRLYTEQKNSLSLYSEKSITEFQYMPEESGALWSYSTPKMYLPPGNYRIMVEYDDVLLWQKFHLNPRELQTQVPSTSQMRNINMGNVPVRALPLDLHYKAINRITNLEIKNDLTLSLKTPQGWQPYSESSSKLRSGNEYQLRVDAEGYYTEYAMVKAAPRQRYAKIIFRMQPLPGKLKVIANNKEIQWTLNNSKIYISGTEDPNLQQLPELKEKVSTLTLSPGKYTIQLYHQGESVETTFSVTSQETYSYRAFWDKETKSLKLEAIE